MPDYNVNQGDCLLSIAADAGVSWKTIWYHPNNAELRQRRNDPNVLLPGDVVFVPDKVPRVETRATDQKHKFVKKGQLAKVRLRLLDYRRQPRQSAHYSASVDGAIQSGTTDAGGYLTLSIPPGARQVKLTVMQGSRKEEYTLPLGSIDPVEELTGVQQRLANLGYPCDSEIGTLGDNTVAALRAFQQEMNLRVTGEIDNPTRQKLKEKHGC